ncbi:bacilysin biosynthesis protein BacA [Metabacillus arenae]|uniref:Bacilysin biosynthesis protein BacA n=1 Tax=Metabacillus arenae TaxID=2771434 RepID=A0A926NI56_9BACI|nr:bacilysin biosynthesis protein BacA [Metabacillus arenae]MBD1381490.1 bacilysin biosynthesis protein BacA [Metabacillus arenae]
MAVKYQVRGQNHRLSNWNDKLFSSLFFLDQLEIATLGPSGTSSEASAEYLLSSLKANHGKYTLFPSYEEAYESLVLGESNVLLVANAYKGIDKFYMSKEIQFLFPYVFETPFYGVAKRPYEELDTRHPLIIATHHAPSSLLPWFLAEFNMNYDVLLVNSTSEAAVKLKKGDVDLCLTTENAVNKYNIEFISPTRTILMLWSVFGRNQ